MDNVCHLSDQYAARIAAVVVDFPAATNKVCAIPFLYLAAISESEQHRVSAM